MGCLSSSRKKQMRFSCHYRLVFPVVVALRQWGESHLFSRGEKRLQVLDKRTGKPPRVEVQNAKGETVTADDLELVTVKN